MDGMKKANPLTAVNAIWNKNSVSKYPETIRIPMDDGLVINYKLDHEKQPHPSFIFAMNLLKRWPNGSYQYKGGGKEKHRIL